MESLIDVFLLQDSELVLQTALRPLAIDKSPILSKADKESVFNPQEQDVKGFFLDQPWES